MFIDLLTPHLFVLSPQTILFKFDKLVVANIEYAPVLILRIQQCLKAKKH